MNTYICLSHWLRGNFTSLVYIHILLFLIYLTQWLKYEWYVIIYSNFYDMESSFITFFFYDMQSFISQLDLKVQLMMVKWYGYHVNQKKWDDLNINWNDFKVRSWWLWKKRGVRSWWKEDLHLVFLSSKLLMICSPLLQL